MESSTWERSSTRAVVSTKLRAGSGTSLFRHLSRFPFQPSVDGYVM